MRTCWRCRKNEADPGYNSCLKCRQRERKLRRRARDILQASGLCVRCGVNPPKEGKRTCQQCITSASDAKALIEAGRRDEGTCVLCGNDPKPGFKYCEQHLALTRSYARKKATKATEETRRKNAERVKRTKNKWREQGRCIVCGKRAERNPRTMRFKTMCSMHLEKARKRKVRKARKSTAA